MKKIFLLFIVVIAVAALGVYLLPKSSVESEKIPKQIVDGFDTKLDTTEQSTKQISTNANLLPSEAKMLKNARLYARSLGDVIPIVGIIDSGFRKKIRDIIPANNQKLLISSLGGNVNHAYVSALLIQESKHSITIIGYCVSACAEYLLPASERIYFLNSPLIGFHGSPLSKASLLRQKYGPGLKVCEPNFGHIKNVENFYKKQNVSAGFIKNQYQYLDVISVSKSTINVPVQPEFENIVIEGQKVGELWKDCAVLEIITKHEMWFPTSIQLREGFGIKFEGDVCADDRNCYEGRIDRLYPKGTSLAVGDTVYFSKGPSE